MKMTVIALVLFLAPSLSAAMGCSGSHEQAMSCAEGTTWDSDAGACVPAATS